MNYSKLKNILKDKNISLDIYCQAVGLTKGGFHQMVRNESMKVSTLEQTISFLNVPVTEFFEEDSQTYKSNDKITLAEEQLFNKNPNSEMNLLDYLTDSIKTKNQLIEKLTTENEQLRKDLSLNQTGT